MPLEKSPNLSTEPLESNPTLFTQTLRITSPPWFWSTDERNSDLLIKKSLMLQHSYCSFPLWNGPFAKQLCISQAINTKPNFLPVSAGKPLLVVSCQMAPKQWSLHNATWWSLVLGFGQNCVIINTHSPLMNSFQKQFLLKTKKNPGNFLTCLKSFLSVDYDKNTVIINKYIF